MYVWLKNSIAGTSGMFIGGASEALASGPPFWGPPLQVLRAINFSYFWWKTHYLLI